MGVAVVTQPESAFVPRAGPPPLPVAGGGIATKQQLQEARRALSQKLGLGRNVSAGRSYEAAAGQVLGPVAHLRLPVVRAWRRHLRPCGR